MAKNRIHIPKAVLELACNAPIQDTQKIIKAYKENGAVPPQYRKQYYDAFFAGAKQAVEQGSFGAERPVQG